MIHETPPGHANHKNKMGGWKPDHLEGYVLGDTMGIYRIPDTGYRRDITWAMVIYMKNAPEIFWGLPGDDWRRNWLCR